MILLLFIYFLAFYFFSSTNLQSKPKAQKEREQRNRRNVQRERKNRSKSIFMAVEARQPNLFNPQLLCNREIINAIENNANFYNTQMGFGLPLSGTTAETLLPFYNNSCVVAADSVPATTTMKADSGLTYSLPVPRKRSRDYSTNSMISFPATTQNDNRCGSFSFLGEDISFQIQQQQLEIDRLIAQHTEKVRLEIAERRKRHSRRLVAAVEEGIVKRLKAKEEEMEKIEKLNWVLEERVKSLCVENQIWRDLAQTNEATANALRSNLEQVLAQVSKEERAQQGGAAGDEAVADDAESCCGSSDECESRRTLAEPGGERKLVKDDSGGCGGADGRSGVSNRWCRNCGKEESCVLLIPCRHLCLCTLCGSTLHTCPICKTNKNAFVHVNMC